MKPPNRFETVEEAKLKNDKLVLHTDLNLWDNDPLKPQFQGGLCLRDCPEGGGGFFCLPKFHKREIIDEYKSNYENGLYGTLEIPKPFRVFMDYKDQVNSNKNKIEIVLNQGDFVIWNSNLPHNGGVNSLVNHWRLHAYVRFVALNGPCVDEKRINMHKEYLKIVSLSSKSGNKPSMYSTGNSTKISGDPTPETLNYKLPPLSWIGERVLGFKSWDDLNDEKK